MAIQETLNNNFDLHNPVAKLLNCHLLFYTMNELLFVLYFYTTIMLTFSTQDGLLNSEGPNLLDLFNSRKNGNDKEKSKLPKALNGNENQFAPRDPINLRLPFPIPKQPGSPSCCIAMVCYNPCPYAMPAPYYPQMPDIPMVLPARTYYEPVIHNHPPLHKIQKIIKNDKKESKKGRFLSGFDTSSDTSDYMDTDYFDTETDSSDTSTDTDTTDSGCDG